MSGDLNKFNKALWYVIGLCVLVYALAYYQSQSFPSSTDIHPELYEQPQQTKTSASSFLSEYDDKQYMIRPQYDYDLYGLVVSYRNLNESWFNIYYERDPYNIKDLCVIWGGNLANNDFTKAEYSSGIWTCYVRWKRDRPISMTQLSNNHILPATEEIAKVLQDIHIGDQIHFQGHLVNYSTIGDGGGERKSSITREDHGKRACEVVYVTNLEVLQQNNAIWHVLKTLSMGLIALGLVLKGYLFFAI